MENLDRIEATSDDMWAICEDAPNYEVSMNGTVRRLTPGHGARVGYICGVFMHYRGYPSVSLRVGSTKNVSFKVHRLVAKAFVSNPMGLETVNHIDGNKLNNSASNLEWCSMESNREHAIQSGLIKIGSAHHASRLSEADVLDVVRRLDSGESRYSIAKSLGVDKGTIVGIDHGKTWKRLTNRGAA